MPAGERGACVCCSAYEKRIVWVDHAEHFTCKRHEKAVRNSSVTVIPRGCRGDPFDNVSGENPCQDEWITAGRGCTSDIILGVRGQFVDQHYTSGRSPDIITFYPSSCQASDGMDGVSSSILIIILNLNQEGRLCI